MPVAFIFQGATATTGFTGPYETHIPSTTGVYIGRAFTQTDGTIVGTVTVQFTSDDPRYSFYDLPFEANKLIGGVYPFNFDNTNVNVSKQVYIKLDSSQQDNITTLTTGIGNPNGGVTGSTGDYYGNITTKELFGPKLTGGDTVWPAISLTTEIRIATTGDGSVVVNQIMASQVTTPTRYLLTQADGTVRYTHTRVLPIEVGVNATDNHEYLILPNNVAAPYGTALNYYRDNYALGLQYIVTKDLTVLSAVFLNKGNFNTNISTWDVSNVNTLNSAFKGATSFNQPLLDWDTGNVTNMTSAFDGADAFNQSLANWNVGKVTTFSLMFGNTNSFNGSLTGWNIGATAATVTMINMFRGATAFNQDISDWNVSKVNIMTSMFFQASSFNQNLSNWERVLAPDTSTLANVTDMTSMFYFATAFNGQMNSWNVGKVASFNGMFTSAIAFNQNINTWPIGNTASTVNMEGMFLDAASYNQPLNLWNVSKVTTMKNMFKGALAFSQDLSNWERIGSSLSNVTTTEAMFSGATAFNGTVDNWNLGKVATFTSMFSSASSFDQPVENWVIGTTATNITVFGIFQNAVKFNKPLAGWERVSPTISTMSKVTVAQSMFNNATLFNQPLSNWDVGRITNFGAMFASTLNFSQELEAWNIGATATSISMSSMFSGASAFNCPLGAWDVSDVVSMNLMFQNAKSFNRNLNYWNTGLTAPSNFYTGGNTAWTGNPDWQPKWGATGPIATNNVLTGCTSIPNPALGSTGDYYVSDDDYIYGPKGSTGWGLPAIMPSDVLVGYGVPLDGNPPVGTGVDGNYYVRSNTSTFSATKFYDAKGATVATVWRPPVDLDAFILANTPPPTTTPYDTMVTIRTTSVQGNTAARNSLFSSHNIFSNVNLYSQTVTGFSVTGVSGPGGPISNAGFTVLGVTADVDYRIYLDFNASEITPQGPATLTINFITTSTPFDQEVLFEVDNIPELIYDNTKNLGTVYDNVIYVSPYAIIGLTGATGQELFLNGETLSAVNFDLYKGATLISPHTLTIGLTDLKLNIPTGALAAGTDYSIQNITVTDADSGEVIAFSPIETHATFEYVVVPLVAPTIDEEVQYYNSYVAGSSGTIATLNVSGLNDAYVLSRINESPYLVGSINVTDIQRISYQGVTALADVNLFSERTGLTAQAFSYVNPALQITNILIGSYTIKLTVIYKNSPTASILNTDMWSLDFESTIKVTSYSNTGTQLALGAFNLTSITAVIETPNTIPLLFTNESLTIEQIRTQIKNIVTSSDKYLALTSLKKTAVDEMLAVLLPLFSKTPNKMITITLPGGIRITLTS
jgi:surface protein